VNNINRDTKKTHSTSKDIFARKQLEDKQRINACDTTMFIENISAGSYSVKVIAMTMIAAITGGN